MKAFTFVCTLMLFVAPAFADDTLTDAEQRLNLESFDYVWTTIRDSHFDPEMGGVDWNAVRDELRPLVEEAQTMPDVRRAIVDMIAQSYHPTRVYQWGSVLRPERFRDYSDIDIAVEGVLDAETFFHMLGAAQAMTKFDLDLVQIEKIVPEYAEDIRTHGKIAYERR